MAGRAGKVDWLAGATFAHRGLHGAGVIENSPSAFAGAIAAGFGIECDVQLSADGEAMVFHDFTLERLTCASGAVSARTAAELCALHLRGSSEPIVRLAQLLAEVAGRVPLLIEVKMRAAMPAAPLCAAVARALALYQGDLAVMSFDPRVPRWFARHAPDTARGLVMSRSEPPGPLGPISRMAGLWLARPDFLALDINDLPSRFARRQRAHGRMLASWTIRSPDLLARARACVDAPIAEGAGIPR